MQLIIFPKFQSLGFVKILNSKFGQDLKLNFYWDIEAEVYLIH